MLKKKIITITYLWARIMQNKASVPKGTRDFGPLEMRRRTFIFDTIRQVFYQFGFQGIETPSMENLDTLSGKYGDEGDKLIFKILNSGDFLANADSELLSEKNSKKVTRQIAEKALRYDLTVPFARYVVQHRNEIALPFKRFQIQPVWRADRPQKGRYREFYQCDADVVGSTSLLLEAELISIYDQALYNLGLTDFTIKINNRKILAGIAESIGAPDKMMAMTIAIDKLDKIGFDGVAKELLEQGFMQEQVEDIKPVLNTNGSNSEKIQFLKSLLKNSEIGQKGIKELEQIFGFINPDNLKAKLELDITLARGLNYYTGAILEVKANNIAIGSIGGGGRYDDLTGIFGMPGISGVGISFGADRIYDVMEELNIFPENAQLSTQVLFTPMNEACQHFAFSLAQQLRAENISCEVYPDLQKLKKQIEYADKRSIPYVAIIGDSELGNKSVVLKNLHTGEQQNLDLAALLTQLKK